MSCYCYFSLIFTKNSALQSCPLLILRLSNLCNWILLQDGFPVFFDIDWFFKIYQAHLGHFMLESWHQPCFPKQLWFLERIMLFWKVFSSKSVLHSESCIYFLFLQLNTCSVSHHECNLPIYNSATSASGFKASSIHKKLLVSYIQHSLNPTHIFCFWRS